MFIHSALLVAVGLSALAIVAPASAAEAGSSTASCQNVDNLLDCVRQLEYTETVPAQTAPVQRYSMRHLGQDQQFQWLEDGREADLFVLHNGLILQSTQHPAPVTPATPCLALVWLNLTMGDLSTSPLTVLQKALGAGAALPTLGKPFIADYHGFWDYGKQDFHVKLEAVSATQFRFDIVKTAILTPEGKPVGAPEDKTDKIDKADAACPLPRISEDEAALRIKNHQHVESCQVDWQVFDNSDAQAASLARLAPVGQHLSGSFDLAALPALPNDDALAQWQTEDGKRYATLGAARQQTIDRAQILQRCGLK